MLGLRSKLGKVVTKFLNISSLQKKKKKKEIVMIELVNYTLECHIDYLCSSFKLHSNIISPIIRNSCDCNSFLDRREDTSTINCNVWLKLIQFAYQTELAFKNKVLRSLVNCSNADESHQFSMASVKKKRKILKVYAGKMIVR